MDRQLDDVEIAICWLIQGLATYDASEIFKIHLLLPYLITDVKNILEKSLLCIQNGDEKSI
jgi:hypothetical protein